MRPTIATVRKSILDTPLDVKATVWSVKKVRRKGRRVSVRHHHFGWYDPRKDLIVLGLMENKSWGQADELVNTHIHEVLHRVRPEWSESIVRMEEKRYTRSRVLREASMTKILNVTLFDRDLDVLSAQFWA